jgi:hypothetical protein
LVEETGLDPSMISACAPFCLVYDRVHSVFDVGVRIELKIAIEPEALYSDEYDDFAVVAWDEVCRLFEVNEFVPTSKALYAALGRGV